MRGEYSGKCEASIVEWCQARVCAEVECRAWAKGPRAETDRRILNGIKESEMWGRGTIHRLVRRNPGWSESKIGRSEKLLFDYSQWWDVKGILGRLIPLRYSALIILIWGNHVCLDWKSRPRTLIESVTRILRLLRRWWGNWLLGFLFSNDDVNFEGRDAETKLY